MSEPYLGEIRVFGGTFAPQGWNFCNGDLLPISGNDALYSLIGTAYGGDGQTTFAVPDLRGRVAVHNGSGYDLGSTGGLETVTLTTGQIPAHTHTAVAASADGTVASPANALWATVASQPFAPSGTGMATMSPTAISSVGGSLPHDNMMPYLAVNYIIALQGIWPSRP